MNAEPTPRRARTRKVLLFGVALMLVLFLAVVATVYLQGPRRWRALIDEMEGPVTFDQLMAAAEPIPDEDNLRLLLEPLAERLEAAIEDPRVAGLLPPLGDFERADTWPVTYTPERIAATRAFVDDHADLYDQLPRYSAGQRGRREYASGQEMLMELYKAALPSAARHASKLLALRTHLLALEGSNILAVGDIEAMVNLAWSYHQEPTLISGLMQVAVVAMAVDALEKSLVHVELDDATASRLIDVLSERAAEDVVYWAVRGERAFMIGTSNALMAPDGGAIIDLPNNPLRHAPWLIKADLVHAVQRMTELVDASEDGPAALLEVARAQDNDTLPAYAILSGMLTPSVTRAVEMFLRGDAQLHSAITALACERYRLAQGAWPEALDELVPRYLPAVPIDPFDGAPLRYKKTTAGIVIYSIGENGVDDGGDLISRKKPTYGYEIPDTGFRIMTHRGVQ